MVTMNTISIVDLAPVIAAILGPMLVVVAALMRYQHVDSTRTRDLIAKYQQENNNQFARFRLEVQEQFANARRETQEQFVGAKRENQEIIKGLRQELVEHRLETRESLAELRSGLADTRERLARIEGHLGIGIPITGQVGGEAADAA